MVNSYAGFDGTLTETQESNIKLRHSEGGYRHVVWSGGNVTSGTGLAVNVSALDAVAAGIWFTLDAGSVTLTSNPGTNKRIDVIVAIVDWTANTVTLGKVTGTAAASPVAPTLTQTVGGTWQMPLARVTVPAAGSSIPAANIEPCKPLPRKMYIYSGTFATPNTISQANADGKNLSTVNVTDPGWPYYLDVTSQVRVGGDGTGYLATRIMVDGSTTIGRGMSDLLHSGGGTVVSAGFGISDAITGSHSVVLNLLPDTATQTGTVFSLDGAAIDRFIVRQIPA